MTDTTETIEVSTVDALILSGSGYDIQIAPDAIERKALLITAAADVTQVTDAQESFAASFEVRRLAALRIEVEKCRTAVKAPVIAVGKRIDKAAKEFLADIEAQESRLKKLVSDHAEEVERVRLEKEAAERKAAEEARRAREEAERKAAAADESRKMSDVIAAKQAERELEAARAARMEAAEETHAARAVDGVRFAWDFEVVDVDALYFAEPDLVEIKPRRSEILAAIKELESEALPVALPGLRIFKKPIVSTR